MTEWNPTRRQIAAACKRIQAAWTDDEREQRARHFADETNHFAKTPMELAVQPYVVPMVRAADLELALG